MATTMRASLRVDIDGAGSSAATWEMSAEAFGKIEVTVPADGSTQTQVQPGGAGQVGLVFLTADQYSADLTYTVSNGGVADVVLDAPQLLMGAGGVGLLTSPPNTITFENASLTDEFVVTILVGRDATP